MDLPICDCADVNVKNLHSDEYSIYNFLLIVIILPMIALFGLISNIINVFIYTRPSMVKKLSANVYLAALGCSDFCVILTGIFAVWLDSARSYLPTLNPIMYEALPILTLGYMAITSSIYFTVAAAIDCYIRVCWVMMSKKWCNSRTALMVVIVIAVLSIGYNMNRFWQFDMRDCLENGTLVKKREICATQLYDDLNLIYNFYINTATMVFTPFFLLSLINILIIRRLQSMKTVQAQLQVDCGGASSSDCGGGGGSQSNVDNTDDGAVTLVMVVVLFLVCNSLSLVLIVIENFFTIAVDPLLMHYMSDMSSTLVIINSSVNFWIYLIFNRDFKENFIKTICCWPSSKCDQQQEQLEQQPQPLNRRSRKVYLSFGKKSLPAKLIDTKLISNDRFDSRTNRFSNPATDFWPKKQSLQWTHSVPKLNSLSESDVRETSISLHFTTIFDALFDISCNHVIVMSATITQTVTECHTLQTTTATSVVHIRCFGIIMSFFGVLYGAGMVNGLSHLCDLMLVDFIIDDVNYHNSIWLTVIFVVCLVAEIFAIILFLVEIFCPPHQQQMISLAMGILVGKILIQSAIGISMFVFQFLLYDATNNVRLDDTEERCSCLNADPVLAVQIGLLITSATCLLLALLSFTNVKMMSLARQYEIECP